jgi:hypothetical protein
MHNDTSSGITNFEASSADRPLRQSRYGNVDFDCFLRNQPRYTARPVEGVGGWDRSPVAPSLLRINEPLSGRSDYYHKTPGNLGRPTRSMNLPP